MGYPGRRLLLFFDGTGNRAVDAEKVVPTNVFKLNRALTPGFQGVAQIVHCFAGVGTRGDKVSQVTAKGFDQIVMEAFINLGSNYMEGDTIYLIGFSRGAAAARALSALMSKPGLVSADRLESFPQVWRYFLNSNLPGTEDEELFNHLREIRFNPQPRVKFLGVFDTVPGSSWDRFKVFAKVRFDSEALEESVDNAVHIVSIDDNRNPSFSPALWRRKSDPLQRLEQIWMPGVHADIGGCSDSTFLGNIALLTMVDRMQHYCPELEWDQPYIDRIKESIENVPRIEITDERPDLARQLLGWKLRSMPPYNAKDNICFTHPVFSLLHSRTFPNRGLFQPYEPQNVNSSYPILPVNSDLNKLWESVCRRLLN